MSQDILDIPIGNLKHCQIDARLWCCLMNSNYKTLRETQSAPDYELLRIPNLGRKSLQRLRSFKFQDDPKENPRNAKIITQHQNGETYVNIAAAFDISKTRVRQIVAQNDRWNNRTQ